MNDATQQDKTHSFTRRGALAAMSLAGLGAMVPWSGAQATPSKLRGFLRTNWSRDPFSYGSYSYVPKGARQRDRKTLSAPVQDVLFFAGEAANAETSSTVHAAYHSGIAAARAVARTSAKSVGVVGAGISGMAAAHRLAQAGYRVTVIEARDRIGGRIWTTPTLGPSLDLGASWIHGAEGNPITTLAHRAGAATVATDDSFISRGANGRAISDGNRPTWLDDTVYVQHSAGADPDQLNMWAYNTQPDDMSGTQLIFPKGYLGIFYALQGNYDLRLSEPVRGVRYDNAGVSVTTNKTTEDFDAVILTVPLGVLQQGDISFEPALPQTKRRAIARLAMGTLDKLYLQFDDVFWDKDVTWIETPETGLPIGQFNSFLNFSKPLGEPILMAFNGGSAALALAQESDGQVVGKAMSVLARVYGAS